MPMTASELVEQVMELPSAHAQQAFLAAHVSSLDEEVATLFKAQADHYLRSDSQRALQITHLLYHLAGITGDPAHRALALRAEGNVCYISEGEYRRAVELYAEASQTYRGLGRPVDAAMSLVGTIGALSLLGRYAEALETGTRVSQVLEEHGELQTLAGLLVNLGNVHSRAGDDAGALATYDRAAALYRQLNAEGDPTWLLAQQNRAIALRTLGRFEESIQASHTALAGLEQLGQLVEAARARQNLALTYFLLGRYNETLEHLDQVREVFLADGRQRDAMLVELFISDCLLQLRRFDEVLAKCRRVRGLFADIGTQRVVGQAIVNEAVACAELRRYPEALASLAEARQIFEKEGNVAWMASSDLETAAVLLRQDRFDESLTAAEHCAAIFEAHDMPVEMAQARLVGARAALAMEQCDRALHLATRALEVGQQHNVPALTYRGQQLLGALAAAEGNQQAALVAFDQAIEAIEQLRGRLMVEFRVGFVEDKEEIYQDAVALCLDLDQPLLGLEYAERAKSRALLDLLAYRLDLGIQARDPGDRPIVDELLRLRAERDQLYRRWEGDADAGQRGWSSKEGDRGQAQQEVLALEARITELWHRLLVRNADYARDAALWTVRAEPAQPYLSDGTLLVEFYGIRGAPIVFLVARDAVRARHLEADLGQIQKLVQFLGLNMRAAARSGPGQLPALTANAQGILGRLHELLLAPLAGDLEPFERLIIVPHGPLHYLPCHALYDGSSYLLQRHEISYLPGASFLRYCQDEQTRPGSMTAIGHSFGGRLPHTLEEARTVAADLDGELLLEDEATLDRVQRNMGACRVLHIAAHGDFRSDNPLFSGLALADGWLTTLDIFNQRLRASLVTLSACQTGRNVVGGGDELLGLMRAFLGAGAASLVLSLWAVEDRSTALLMEAFYDRLGQGWTKGQALRQAQMQLLMGENQGEQRDYSHPYFWAPFFLVGNTGSL